MKKFLIIAGLLMTGVASEAALVRLVPEHGVSKAFTLKTDSDVEYVVRFYRPDVFRVEAAPKIWSGEVPQLIAVDIPADHHWIKFDFNADDDSAASKSAKGVWKNVEFVAE